LKSQIFKGFSLSFGAIGKWSEVQQTHHQRFKLAVAYAKAAMAEPTVRAQSPFDLAVSDYFKVERFVSPSNLSGSPKWRR